MAKAQSTGNVGAGATPVSTPAASSTVSAQPGEWVEDTEVTTTGKSAARAREFLNWSLAIKEAGFSSSTSGSPQALLKLWQAVRNIVSFLYLGIIIIIAFGLILHLDWAEKSRRALVSLIIVFALTFLSFSAEVLTIRLTDKVEQTFFTIHKASNTALTADQKHLKAEDLLTVSFSYQSFTGYRRVGPKYDEAVKNHLSLIKITTATNYAIGLLIVLRIIILWGLVIFSPFVLPFFVFNLTKKVAIIWVREFFRWLFLGPLFALFITAVPYIWQKTEIDVSGVYPGQKAQKSGIPIEINTGILRDNNGATSDNVYQSGTNVLLTPPKNTNMSPTIQDVISNGNNLTETDTYSRYIIAILMLWSAILLPFLLLRIAMGFSVEIGKGISNVWNKSSAQQYLSSINVKGAPPPPTGPVKPGPSSVILKQLREIPQDAKGSSPLFGQKMHSFDKQFSATNIFAQTGLKQQAPQAFETIIKEKIGLEDLAKLEQKDQDVKAAGTVFDKIAYPEKIQDKIEAAKYANIKQAIADQDLTGNETARSLKNAVAHDTGRLSRTNALDEIKESALKNLLESLSSSQENSSSLKNRLSAQAGSNELARNALAGMDSLNSLRHLANQDHLNQDERQQISREVVSLRHPELIEDVNKRNQYGALKNVLTTGAHLGDAESKQLWQKIRDISIMAYKDLEDLKQKSFQTVANNYITSLSEARQALTEKPQSQSTQLAISAIDKMLSAIGDQNAALQNIKENGLRVFFGSANKLQDLDKLNEQEREEFTALKNETAVGDPKLQNLQKSTQEVIEEAGNSDQIEAESTDELRDMLSTDEELKRLQSMWEEYYMGAPVPLSEQIKTRTDWVSKEKQLMETTLQGLLSSDQTKRDQAIKDIGQILPFVVMGKYKSSQIAKYLLAKLDGADAALNALNKSDSENEEDLVAVKRNSQSEAEQKHLSLEE